MRGNAVTGGMCCFFCAKDKYFLNLDTFLCDTPPKTGCIKITLHLHPLIYWPIRARTVAAAEKKKMLFTNHTLPTYLGGLIIFYTLLQYFYCKKDHQSSHNVPCVQNASAHPCRLHFSCLKRWQCLFAGRRAVMYSQCSQVWENGLTAWCSTCTFTVSISHGIATHSHRP